MGVVFTINQSADPSPNLFTPDDNLASRRL
jgi:hypothetical protein